LLSLSDSAEILPKCWLVTGANLHPSNEPSLAFDRISNSCFSLSLLSIYMTHQTPAKTLKVMHDNNSASSSHVNQGQTMISSLVRPNHPNRQGASRTINNAQDHKQQKHPQKRPERPGTGFTNISTIFLSFFYLFSKSLLNCF
jgi:hypothetical protein